MFAYFFAMIILLRCGSGLCPMRSAVTQVCLSGNGSGSAMVWTSPVGILDTSFNGTGLVSTATGTWESIYGIVFQPDGKILAGGYAIVGANENYSLARYHSNGSLDTTFNGTGVVTVPAGASADVGRGLLLQSDGKIILAGYSGPFGSRTFSLARYHSNGSLDTNFNTTGFVTTAIGTTAEGRAVALQSDGKIVVCGYADTGVAEFTVARYHSNGSLDTTFNGTGYRTTASGSGALCYSLVVQPDGKIIGVGEANGATYDFIAVRYHSNGSLDTTFNGTGVVLTPIMAGTDSARSVALQSDGKIVAGGFADTGGFVNGFAVARYHSNGSLDTTFNTTGFVTTSIAPGSQGNAIALQPDGKILITGTINNDFGTARYHSNGSLDTTFGTGGSVATVFAADSNAFAIGQQSDGKILIGGYVATGTFDFAIARLR